MNTQTLITFCETAIGLISLYGIIVIVGAVFYDLRQIFQIKRLKTIVYKLNKNRQPRIVVLIFTENDDPAWFECINSIAHSNYKNYQIVVVDNASDDQTKNVIKLYQQKYPKVPLVTYFKRKADSRAQALHQAYKKADASELVLVLYAKSFISAKTIKECAAQFFADPTLDALRLGRKITSQPSLFVVLQQFFQTSFNQYNKFRFLLPLKKIKLDSGTMYNSSLFKELVKPRNNRAYSYLRQRIFYKPNCKVKFVYNRNMYITNHGSVSIKSLLFPSVLLPRLLNSSAVINNKRIATLRARFIKSFFVIIYLVINLIILAIPLLITYFIYIATTLQSSSFLMLSWLVLVIWLMAAIWVDEHSRLYEKIELTFCVPMAYFFLYAQLFILFIATIVRILNPANFKITIKN